MLINSFEIYPNPTTGIISTKGVQNGNYTLTDISGRTIVNSEFSESTINITQIPQGLFFMHLKSETGEAIIKIVKE